MKKVVLRLDLHDDKRQQKAIRAVSGVPGISQITLDMKEQKMTVIGTVDPVDVLVKLRGKVCPTALIIAVGPAEEKRDDKKDADKK